MGQLLNFTIGLASVFLLVSLYVTTIQELISQALALRARYLRVGIVNLLNDGKSALGVLGARSIQAPLVEKFFADPLIEALRSNRLGRTSDPSYVSKQTFTSVALQITDIIGHNTPEQILQAARNLRNESKSPLAHAIASFAEETGGNLNQLQERIGQWFDEAMDRVSGAYKRWTQVATVIIGISFAAALNANSIAIAQWLISSPEQAAVLADLNAKLPSKIHADPELRDQLLKAIDQTKVPFGWPDQKERSEPKAGGWILMIVGWIFTGLAASLGSAFWFDTLKRFVSIRSSGGSPVEKPKEGT